jgi:hypothetical protein
MSSTDTVRGINMIIQKQMLPSVPKRWNKQFNFGIKAYGLRPFQSAGSNARSVVANPNTAADFLLVSCRMLVSMTQYLVSLSTKLYLSAWLTRGTEFEPEVYIT